VTATTQTLILYDERLNRFINTIDLDETIKTLGSIIEEFRDRFPIADYNLVWPPEKLVIPMGREDSSLKVLYRVLHELLDLSGWPVTILQRMTVSNHEPRKTTVLQLSPKIQRLVRLN
jgi:hypothetical protein